MAAMIQYFGWARPSRRDAALSGERDRLIATLARALVKREATR